MSSSPVYIEPSDSKDQPLSPVQSAQESDFLRKEWVRELPEDLDVAIAQRDFEGAVDLIIKSGVLLLLFVVTFRIDFDDDKPISACKKRLINYMIILRLIIY